MTVQPTLQVGIMAEETISFELSGDYTLNGERCESYYQATIEDDLIIVKSKNEPILTDKEFIFHSTNIDDSFLLEQVTIGINFHWEQRENQRFRGDLKLLIEDGKVRAVNVVPLEEYLRSVISSEMSASSSTSLLKAHAVISRSWLLAQMEKSKRLKAASTNSPSTQQNETEHIRWYDREDHQLFDVCSDDHCQRYQGISKIIGKKASQAIDETFGEVLVAGDEICDARFSKCCGGVSENFENVWEPVRHSYLTKIVDSEQAATTCIDLRQEEEAEDWIRNNPPAFCNTDNKQILSQVLPDFDQKTVDFYRWQISYQQQELSALLQKKTGIDFGKIIRLEAVQRGHSSRIIKLKITGSKQTLVIGKELEIRRALSKSHLYSSAFVVDHLGEQNGIPQQFVINGAGWGHGVGLCQIGAAVMGEKGFNYQSILKHYFQGSDLKKIY
ncbi:SpoIID/LytB domain-containing protein [Sunxiuqinia indica]|uniref:SpoIID/LytB domain-containing protein n=1 Tax=Sunxiuqinia indica TaxID=2692584 RepID=UPI00135C00FD|nr:SpoIID/LytB domain-containing protein [Sunxiuqinia indica]